MAKFLYEEGNYKGCVFMSAVAMSDKVKYDKIPIVERLVKGKKLFSLNRWYEVDALKRSGLISKKKKIEECYLQKGIDSIELEKNLKKIIYDRQRDS